MRALLTSGIKAILAVAALSTAAHWALRVQREAAPAASVASIPDPVATGSIEPRATERPLAAIGAPASAISSAMPSATSSPPHPAMSAMYATDTGRRHPGDISDASFSFAMPHSFNNELLAHTAFPGSQTMLLVDEDDEEAAKIAAEGKAPEKFWVVESSDIIKLGRDEWKET